MTKLSKNEQKLVLDNQDLAKNIAYSIHKTLPQHVSVEDLISDGHVGLIDAAQKFDSSFGYKFETYASFRIRGEILDRLRTADWAPRSLRLKNREINNAIDVLSKQLGYEPSNSEVAILLGWDVEEVDKIIGESSFAVVTNIHSNVTIDGDQLDISDIIPDLNTEVSNMEYDYLRSKLVSALEILSDQEKAIMYLYYSKNTSLKEIGMLFGFTESRACQIHTSALSSLWECCLSE